MKTVAVIGLGNITKRHRKNLKILYPGAQILAVSASGRNPLAVEDADLVVDSVRALVALKPDMAIVASPSTLHAEHAELLIRAGIPVLIEKPIAATYEEAQRIAELTEECGASVAIGYCLRYLSSSKAVKSLIDEGVLGDIYNAQVSVGQYLPDWRPGVGFRESVSAQKSLGGGVLRELSHELDLLQWLLGGLDVRSAILRGSAELNLDVEEIADVVLLSESAVVCTVHLDFLQKVPQRTCTLIGSKARVEWDLIDNSVQLISKFESTAVLKDTNIDKNYMYLEMLKDFFSLIEGEDTCLASVKSATETLALIESIELIAGKGIA